MSHGPTGLAPTGMSQSHGPTGLASTGLAISSQPHGPRTGPALPQPHGPPTGLAPAPLGAAVAHDSIAPPMPAPQASVPPRRRTGLVIALLIVGCGATAVVTWLATRGGASSGPIASSADAGTVAVTPPPVDAGELTAEDLASLLDAGRPTSPPPMDAAAVVVAERPKADRPKPDRRVTSGSAARIVETPKHADTKEPVPDPTPEPIATEEPPKPVEEPAPPPLQLRIDFQPNDFDLPGGHDGKLDQIAQHMAKFPRVRLLIVGNAEPDETQKPENLAIARANRVMMLLVNRRVARDRITLDGNANGGRNVVITTR